MKELKDYTDIELKALVYDNVAQIEKAQVNMKVINQELANRTQISQVKPPETEKKPK